MKFKKGDIVEFEGEGTYAAKKGATAGLAFAGGTALLNKGVEAYRERNGSPTAEKLDDIKLDGATYDFETLAKTPLPSTSE